ncbi:Glycosyl transferases group 1 [Prochlorococcus marinus subsp. pastoris str. CCMP1986]|uniref:Glycosyl transferases group 1 n=1 Tax=Prochlorococcus marinus subsp. pastoris (strain CCMP1986 / NIES-2087 / MED4) TaxID=59919 RepID=Q7V0P3_PROMP|nr:glycosyltransferase [Prochlorococcus marinus]KGF87226.1 Glycosyl transferase group 1 [Prochlorococcus marinus str. EQPAC1]CAE19672.1 Glycosyl transferases group 1 [Prochlorococcus marinus subsp. pastoris str. CCMP1986]
MQDSKHKVILFANTLWFLHNFKLPLIEELNNKKIEVLLIYLRLGPPVGNKNKFLLNKVKQYNFVNYIFFYIKNFFSKDQKKTFLFSFTIGPIILSILPIFNNSIRFATLEGLGRIFSSRILLFRILKRILEIVYRIIFLNPYKGIFVLNYADYAYLLEKKIVQISKINIIPGTGIDSRIFNPDNLKKKRINLGILNKKNQLQLDDMYITYIGRISVDKGFYRFIAAINYLLSDPIYSNLKFRIVSPKSDIKNIDTDLKEFLLDKNIVLEEYVIEPINYYATSKLIVIPSTYGEGLSRVALESGLLGIPIVAIVNRGLSSLFIDGILGETTMEIEPYGISKLIKQVINNYSSYSHLPKEVFLNLSSKYDNKASSESVISVLSTYLDP